MGASITTETQINAPPERVWDVLTDFVSYPEWNPFIISIEGSLVEGSRLQVRLQPPGARGINMQPTILAMVPRQELKWLGHFLVPGVFDGEHHFLVSHLDDGSTRFTQEEHFKGVLVPLTGNLLRKTEAGFEQMNQALKERTELGY
jgi:hypothetical protein